MKTILFQGDSITDSMRIRESDNCRGNGYATLVSAKLMYEHPGEYVCLTRGVNGNRSVDVLARMRSDIENLQPDVMSLLIGVNDVWHEITRQNGVSPRRFEKVVDLMLDELSVSRPGMKIMLLEPYVLEGEKTCNTEEIPDRWDRFSTLVPQYAGIIRKLAERYHCAFVPLQDTFSELAAKYGGNVWLTDGVHPTIAGHAVIAKAWLDAYANL